MGCFMLRKSGKGFGVFVRKRSVGGVGIGESAWGQKHTRYNREGNR